MPNNLTDAEVKKALECCSEANNCGQCEYEPTEHQIGSIGCSNELMKDVLDLINRQEGENEKNENIIRIADKTIATLNAENESLKAEVENWQGGYMTQKQEIANLEIELQAMRNAANGFKAEVESLQRQLNNAKLHQKETHKALQDEKALRLNEDFIKAEAYKECIEKVEQRDVSESDFYIMVKKTEFDNLLNELVGDGDGKRKD